MTDNTSTRSRLELRPAEVGVGAGAAVVTAFATSYLGTAGTLLGAALASVVGTVSTAVLRSSAQRTTESLHKTTARLRSGQTGPEMGGSTRADPGLAAVDPADPAVGGTAGAERNATGPTAGPSAAGPASGAAARTSAAAGGPAGGTGGTGGVETATAGSGVAGRWRPRWPVLAAGAVIAFLVALVAITGIESVVGKPLAALVGHDTGTGTTIGRTVGGGGAGATDAPTPTPSQPGTTSPTQAPSPTGEPSPSATPGGTSPASPPATQPEQTRLPTVSPSP